MSDKTETLIIFWGGISFFCLGLIAGMPGLSVGGLICSVYALCRGYKGGHHDGQ